MKNKKNNKAFTLVELMVVIVIIGLMLMLSYAPYSLYQTKAKLRIATREVAQSFYEAKNMAISGVEGEKSGVPNEKQNKVVGLYFTNEENTLDNKNNKVFYYFDDFLDYQTDKGEINENLVSKVETLIQDDIKKEKIKNLEPYIWLRNFKIGSSEYKNIFVLFASSSGNVKVFGQNTSGTWEEVSGDKIEIEMSFKDTTTDILKKTVTYYIKTNIVDYK